jgi:predicted nucleotidyltransferase
MDSMFKFSLSGGAWAADCRRLILRSAWERIAKVVKTRIVEAVTIGIAIERYLERYGNATKARVLSMTRDHSGS